MKKPIFTDYDTLGTCLTILFQILDRSTSPEERKQHIQKLLDLVHDGDVNAEYCLGFTSCEEHSDKANEIMSELWFSSSAEKGHPYGSYSYALCLEKRGDFDRAIQWYEKAADNGVPYAQNRLVELGKRKDAPKDSAYSIPLPHTRQLRMKRPRPRNPNAARWTESTQRYKQAMQTRRCEYTIYDKWLWLVTHDWRGVI